MEQYFHTLKFLGDGCQGCMTCMRVCPTYAIRVKQGKATLLPERCVDCGECIKACNNRAIVALTDQFSTPVKQTHKVAIPTPVLYAQFGPEVTPGQILNALTKIGFDDAYDISSACESTAIAFEEYLKHYKGPRPLISSSCPTVVRLIQVSYPSLTEQIIPIEPPREIAAREMKDALSHKLHIETEGIEAIYITPCPAKMVSIKQPAEKVPSYLDGAVGISDIYNNLLSVIIKEKNNGRGADENEYHRYSFGMNWAIVEGESASFTRERCLSVSGLSYVMQSLEDLENGKLRDIDLLFCYSCVGGCIGGSLTVENLYAARSTVLRQLRKASTKQNRKEILKKYYEGFYFLEARIYPRPLKPLDLDVTKAVEKKRKKDEIYKALPKINCGLCGCPTCMVFAEEVALAESDITDCIFKADKRLKRLQEVYK